MTARQWKALNRERVLLIDESIDGTITVDGRARLAILQACADKQLESINRSRSAVLDALERILRGTQ